MAAPTERVKKDVVERDGEGTLHLTVMGPNAFDTRPLPAAGSVTIGRDEQADVRITDPDASRTHARLHIGAQIEIEDLESANGTRLREKLLPPGQRVPLSPGEAVAIGSTVLMVQRRRPTFRPRRVWPHGYFEGRLEEECERAARPGSTFAVLRLRLTRGPADAGADVLARVLRAGDVLALYAPNEYEALLVDTESEAAEALVRQLDSEISQAGLSCRTALAFFPTDGRTAQALIERVSSTLRARDRPGATSSGEHPTGQGEETPLLSSEAMRKLYFQAERAAAGGINVLILGETGVGQGGARADRSTGMSPRAAGPFVCINCAALSESLLESELFGHEKGAFTGALQAKAGLLEAADGGTVFLDEIGEMPPQSAGQDLAGDRAAPGDPGRLGQAAAHRCPLPGRDQPRPRRGGRSPAVPPGSLFPPEWHEPDHPSAARAPFRDRAPRPSLRRSGRRSR